MLEWFLPDPSNFRKTGEISPNQAFPLYPTFQYGFCLIRPIFKKTGKSRQNQTFLKRPHFSMVCTNSTQFSKISVKSGKNQTFLQLPAFQHGFCLILPVFSKKNREILPEPNFPVIAHVSAWFLLDTSSFQKNWEISPEPNFPINAHVSARFLLDTSSFRKNWKNPTLTKLSCICPHFSMVRARSA